MANARRTLGHVLHACAPAELAVREQQRVDQRVGVRAQAADGLQPVAARVHRQVPDRRLAVATHEHGGHLVAHRVVEATTVLLWLAVEEERHALQRTAVGGGSPLLFLQDGGHGAEGAHVRVVLGQHTLQVGHGVRSTGVVADPAETLLVGRRRVHHVQLGVLARGAGTRRM